MAVLSMISGGILFAIGAYQFWAKAPIPASKNHTDEINSPAASQAETDSDPKIDGLDFEKHIVQRFNKKFFTIKHWAGDKYVYGHYAEANMEPDLLFEFNLPQVSKQFAVECKWRSNWFKGGVSLSSEARLQRYRSFQEKKGVPVFIAIGLGGKASAPLKVFMVPLAAFQSEYIAEQQIRKFEKQNDKSFYLNADNMTLL